MHVRKIAGTLKICCERSTIFLSGKSCGDRVTAFDGDIFLEEPILPNDVRIELYNENDNGGGNSALSGM